MKGNPISLLKPYEVVPLMLIVALIVNNIPKTRKYPEFWLEESTAILPQTR